MPGNLRARTDNWTPCDCSPAYRQPVARALWSGSIWWKSRWVYSVCSGLVVRGWSGGIPSQIKVWYERGNAQRLSLWHLKPWLEYIRERLPQQCPQMTSDGNEIFCAICSTLFNIKTIQFSEEKFNSVLNCVLISVCYMISIEYETVCQRKYNSIYICIYTWIQVMGGHTIQTIRMFL